ncbi:hypothetical protein B9Y60_06785 [Stenotrophomonas maltophilia]|nr:hypothetical protein B9Y73_06785 [Stenotrophomonas maltophilia]PJL56609.1 hypothetical protein B9Y60_06785 [Stenotrophomonas maltophilia]HEP1206608.1 hypothetical protein [Stenotrophomonas maltophilia]
MSRDLPTPVGKPIVMRVKAGTTVFIGNGVQVQLRGAHRNRAEIHIYAPSNMDVDRAVTFEPDWNLKNSDGPSAGTLEPSATPHP